MSTANQTISHSHLRLVDASYLNELRQTPVVTSRHPHKAARFALRRAMVIAVAVVLAMIGYVSVSNSAAQANALSTKVGATVQANEFKYVTVAPGDSLWSIAQKYAPSQDPRDFISDLVALNNLGDSLVQTGQRLALPNTN